MVEHVDDSRVMYTRNEDIQPFYCLYISVRYLFAYTIINNTR